MRSGNTGSTGRRNLLGLSLASAVFVGSLIPDVDHFILSAYRTPFGKGYGHIIYIPLCLVIISGLAIAYLSRRYKVGVLGGG